VPSAHWQLIEKARGYDGREGWNLNVYYSVESEGWGSVEGTVGSTAAAISHVFPSEIATAVLQP